MKIHIEVDCTPDEARTFFGLPNIKPVQEALMREFQEQMTRHMREFDAETLIKTWFQFGAKGWDEMRKAFAAQADNPKTSRGPKA